MSTLGREKLYMARRCLDIVKSRQRKWKITMNEMGMERPTKRMFKGDGGEETKITPRWRTEGQFQPSYHVPYLNLNQHSNT